VCGSRREWVRLNMLKNSGMPLSKMSVPSLEDLDSLFVVWFWGARKGDALGRSRWINARAAELEELESKWVPSFS
jgi:hypothetical protein